MKLHGFFLLSIIRFVAPAASCTRPSFSLCQVLLSCSLHLRSFRPV
ncbi:hypothetical protein DNTS_027524 [Danionella cerebrum]|uniref:Uncharacterized protein n=1 Tax=Danionella cerebrum TaxID=2873325 RepID=A0A553R2N7_9TELE|nr:hypothetical protein DNTS_027524 [Danionella translucida]